jgi:GDP-L-fucose synthase
MNKNAKIYVAGHTGLVGSAICRALLKNGYRNSIYRTSKQLDLRITEDVERFYQEHMPEYVFLSAGHVGGIKVNNEYPADFLMFNLQIQNNVIDASRRYGVKKLIFLGSSCVYPKSTPQPIREEYLLSAPLEPTNQWYAIAKISGIELCKQYKKQFACDFITVMPTNLFGPNDNYNPESSHVLPAMIRRFHVAKSNGAKSVTCWGTGNALREFLHSDDLGSALVQLMETPSSYEMVNIGSGVEVSIRSLSEMVARVVGYSGAIDWDSSQPDGTPRKLLDSSKIRGLGWQPSIQLESGIKDAYIDFLKNSRSTAL